MNILKFLLFITAIVISSNHALANDHIPRLDGLWEWEKITSDGSISPSLSLQLNTENTVITGSYCYITRNGTRIDCDEKGIENVRGEITEDGSANITIRSNYSSDTFKVNISQAGNGLNFRITERPDSDHFFAPNHVTLKRSGSIQDP